MTENNDDYEITVDRNVEKSDDAIDVAELFDEHGEDGAWREILRQFGASESEIDELLEEANGG